MIRVLTSIPHPGDGVDFYRGNGPLSQLRNSMDVEFVPTVNFNWQTLAMCDVVYMVRPGTNNDVAIMDLAHRCGVKVWIDYDDNVLAIPQHNMAHAYYQQQSVRNNIMRLLEKADMVTVSTDALKEALNPYCQWKNITTVKNSFPDHMLDLDAPLVARKKLITWRGSRTHDKDLSLAHSFISNVLDLYPDWNFKFFGEIDYSTIDLFKRNQERYDIVPFTDVMGYLSALHSSGSTVHIVPLVDDEFNRSKSNIAWLEATWSGAAVFSTGLPEFADSSLHLDERLNMLSPNLALDLSIMVKGSVDLIKEKYLLSQNNIKRKEILHFLKKAAKL